MMERVLKYSEEWLNVVQACGSIGTLAAAVLAWLSVKQSQRIRESQFAMERILCLQDVLREFDLYAARVRFSTESEKTRSRPDMKDFRTALRTSVEDLSLCRRMAFNHIPPEAQEIEDVIKTSFPRFGEQIGDPETEEDDIRAMRAEMLAALDDLHKKALSNAR